MLDEDHSSSYSATLSSKRTTNALGTSNNQYQHPFAPHHKLPRTVAASAERADGAMPLPAPGPLAFPAPSDTDMTMECESPSSLSSPFTPEAAPPHIATLTNPSTAPTLTVDCEQIIQTMKTHPNCSETLTTCCEMMANMTDQHAGHCFQFHSLGAALAIVRAMKKYPHQPILQWQACRALTTLAHQAQYASYLLEAGSLDAVLEAMRTYPQGWDLQRSCCQFLYYLAQAPSSSSSVTNSNGNTIKRLIISKGGGIELAASQHRFLGHGLGWEQSVADALKMLHG